MNNALIALRSPSEEAQLPEGFWKTLQKFQEKGLLRYVCLAQVDAPLAPSELGFGDSLGQTPPLAEWLELSPERIEGADDIERLRNLSRLGREHQADLIVLPLVEWSSYGDWLPDSFGSVLNADERLPLLMVQTEALKLSEDPRLIAGVDLSVPLPRPLLHKLAKIAQVSQAQTDLVYVRPRHRFLVDTFLHRTTVDDPEQQLKAIQAELLNYNVQANVLCLDEEESVAQTLVAYAEQQGAWLTIALDVPRSFGEKLLIGSHAKEMLALSRRPYLGLS